jgi:hypothetical protein
MLCASTRRGLWKLVSNLPQIFARVPFPLLILLCILLGTAQLYANPVTDSRKSLNQRGSWGPPDTRSWVWK